ncbi:MAG: DUF1304 domain-containing protein [Chloroflexota bacterium]
MFNTARIFAGIAGIIHVLFFLMESVFWLNPAIHSVFLIDNLADAQLLDVYVKNQGYYNLFLAIGMFVGIWLTTRNKQTGSAIIIYTCLVMIGAAVVLRLTIPDMTSGPYIQGVAPLIALIALQLDRRATA